MDFIWSLNGRQNTKYNFSLFFIKLPDPATDPLAIQQIISCYLCLMIRVGEFNMLKIIREASNGVYLDDGGEGLLLPKRVVPEGAKTGDELKVPPSRPFHCSSPVSDFQHMATPASVTAYRWPSLTSIEGT